MGEKRERKPLTSTQIAPLPVWVVKRFTRTMAHLAIGEARTISSRAGVVFACGQRTPEVAEWLDIAHPDDRRCKRCLAAELKRGEG